MKKIVTIIALGLISTLSIAQNKMKVNEKSANIAGGNQNAFSILIFEADQKLVEKAWKKELKNMGAKVSSKKEIFGDDAQLGAMGANSFDIYAVVKEVNGGVDFTVAVDLGGAFLSSSQHSSQAKEIKNLIYEFAIKTAKEAVSEMIKQEEKVLSGFDKEQESLVKEKAKLENVITNNEKAIEQAKKDIEQAKKDIAENEKNQQNKKQEIEAQKKVVANITAKEAAIN